MSTRDALISLALGALVALVLAVASVGATVLYLAARYGPVTVRLGRPVVRFPIPDVSHLHHVPSPKPAPSWRSVWPAVKKQGV